MPSGNAGKTGEASPEEDFYLLRLISEHPRANAKTLNKLANIPTGAIRENVARHPNADANTLTWLSRDRSQPLWYLVAFNPNTPTPLAAAVARPPEASRRKPSLEVKFTASAIFVLALSFDAIGASLRNIPRAIYDTCICRKQKIVECRAQRNWLR